MRYYSCEVYDPEGSRIFCEDYYDTVKDAKLDMMDFLLRNDTPVGSYSTVYRRYQCGEMSYYSHDFVKENETTIAKLKD